MAVLAEPAAGPDDAQQVAAYQHHVQAYTSHAAAVDRCSLRCAHEAVVNKAMISLLDRIVVGLLGVAFVVGLMRVLDNMNLMRHGQQADRLWSC